MKKKILIIGDNCTDMFKYGKCVRLSPEAPVPVFNPTSIKVSGGMAINVMENLKALGIDCDIFTNEVRPIKTRYIDEVSNQMILRVDEYDQIPPLTADELEKIDFDLYQAVVISDYNKGYLSEADIKYITDKHSLVFMDTKKKLGSWSLGVEVLKLNEKEWMENYYWLLGYEHGDVIITKGKDGAVLNFSEKFPIEEEHEVRDLSGAGDTFLAALVADFTKNNDIRSAIKFANKCASWVVTQKGVVVVDLNKITIT